MHISNVVNTLIFLICVLLCTYIPAGGQWPLPRPCQRIHDHALCKHMTCVERKITPSIHHHIKDMNVISNLLVYDNCYSISCLGYVLYNGTIFNCVVTITVDAQNTPIPLVFMVVDHSPYQMLQLFSFVYSWLIFFRDHCTFFIAFLFVC